MKILNNSLLLDVILIAFAIWWLFGWVIEVKPETIQLEGNTKWCFHSEYASMKDYKLVDTEADQSFIDITPSGGVRVFVPCDFYDKP